MAAGSHPATFVIDTVKRIIHFMTCVWDTSRQMQIEGVEAERWRGKTKLSLTGKKRSSTSSHKQCQTSMFIPSQSRIISYSIFMIALSTLVLMFQIMRIPSFPLRASSLLQSNTAHSLEAFPDTFFSSFSYFHLIIQNCFFFSLISSHPPFNFLGVSTFQIIVGSYLGHPFAVA